MCVMPASVHQLVSLFVMQTSAKSSFLCSQADQDTDSVYWQEGLLLGCMPQIEKHGHLSRVFSSLLIVATSSQLVNGDHPATLQGIK